MINQELDINEFKKVYKTLYPSLCLFAKSYLGDLQLSKDAVQEVFIKIWEKKIAFTDENKAKAYLYKAVKNKSLDVMKSKHVRVMDTHTEVEHLELMETDAFFYKEVVRIETSAIIEKAMSSLPYKCSQIIKLSLNNYSNQEIADTLSLSINTVKTQKKIAYNKMRPLLKEHYHLLLAIILGCN